MKVFNIDLKVFNIDLKAFLSFATPSLYALAVKKLGLSGFGLIIWGQNPLTFMIIIYLCSTTVSL